MRIFQQQQQQAFQVPKRFTFWDLPVWEGKNAGGRWVISMGYEKPPGAGGSSFKRLFNYLIGMGDD